MVTGLQAVLMLYVGCVGLGWRQNSKPVVAQKAPNLPLPVEHGDPILPAYDRQIQPPRHVGQAIKLHSAMAPA